jgi:DNA modification methylase
VSVRILIGDCRDTLRELPDGCVQTCVTSPPYFGLRADGTGEWEGGDPACDHLEKRQSRDDRPRSGLTGGMATVGAQDAGTLARQVCGRCGARRVDRQIGLEPTPDEFVGALVGVFREVRRVLRDDGTVWLNLGDSYAATHHGKGGESQSATFHDPGDAWRDNVVAERRERGIPNGCKPKDLIGIPWMVAFALRADGWYLRSDIIWAKPNPMPESVTDRPTKSHEYLFLLSKGPKYWYDADAIREDMAEASAARYEYGFGGPKAEALTAAEANGPGTRTHPIGTREAGAGRNKRSVWTVATQPYPGAHFATFPPKLIEPCILAGSSPKACGVCGAPWTRVVKNHGPDKINEHDRHTPGIAGRSDNGRQQGLAGVAMGARWERETVGWQPSCAHHDDTGQSVVLDPFAGSGTTGAVALEHGRAFIGCELNPAYGELIRDRLLSAPLALEGFGAA